MRVNGSATATAHLVLVSALIAKAALLAPLVVVADSVGHLEGVMRRDTRAVSRDVECMSEQELVTTVDKVVLKLRLVRQRLQRL